MIASPLFIDVHVSKLKLYFFISVHALAILSILLISDSGVASAALKIILTISVLLSFNQFLHSYQNNIHFSLKSENVLDLSIGCENYPDLCIMGESYVSNIFVQLVCLDEETGVFHNIDLFPDSIEATMHSQLRARLKLA